MPLLAGVGEGWTIAAVFEQSFVCFWQQPQRTALSVGRCSEPVSLGEELRPLFVASCHNINTQHSRQQKQQPYVASQSGSCHMNWTNYVLLTCELSWKASKAASCAGIGLVSLSPSAPLGPFLLLVLAAAGGRRVAGLPPAQLLPVHQETWQTIWRSNKQSYLTLQMYSTTWMHSKNPEGLLSFLHF